MDKNSKQLFIGGNFKSNGDVSFIKSHSAFLNSVEFDTSKVQVALCPVSIHLTLARELFDKKYIISSQNISAYGNGAFTGEVSGKQLNDIGINWTLIGHSERRALFGDTEEAISLKIKQAVDSSIGIIACVGENLEERESNKTLEVVLHQLKTVFNTYPSGDYSKLVIAYEPVWAIGTGKTASPQQAEEVHAEIRKWISSTVNSEETANSIRIIYGGSVTDQNCNELIKEKNIDGFLVGGASLKPAFKTIIESHQFK
jgi:triosephosphate isomerase